MNPIDKYRNRMRAYGEDVHDETYSREARMLQMKMRNTLSYQEIKIWSCEDGVDIDDEDRRKLCKDKRLAVINSDNLNEKYIYSLPGEDIEHGSLIYWMNNYWLVTEKDANMTVYTRATMIQCNHLLKWVAEDGVVHRQWCIVEDGTKLERKWLRDGLVRRKRCAKRIPLIAGTPLEPYSLQRSFETEAYATA